jgi:drug/metabolite transporter (DMT)-like permease
LAIVIGVLVFSTDGIVFRQITLPPITIAFWTQAVAAIILAALQGRGVFQHSPLLKNRSARYRFLVLGTLRAMDTVAFITAVFLAPIAKVIVVAYLFPIYTMLLAYRFLGEQMTRRSIVAALTALAGIVILVWPELGPTSTGDLSGLLLAGFVSLSVAVKRVLLKGFDPAIPSRLILLIEASLGALVLAPFVLLGDRPEVISSQNIMFVVLAGVLYGVVAHTLMLTGLRVVPAGSAAVVGYLEPVLASLLAWWLLGESVSAYTFVGGMLVLAGSFTVMLSHMQRE